MNIQPLALLALTIFCPTLQYLVPEVFAAGAGQLADETILLDGIRGANIHDGGRLKIGPDGKLYATTGDAASGQLAQDLSSLNGKILRLNLDGTIPSDNPFLGSPVYSYGHRHPQGLAWDADVHLVSSEHGPSGNDEINFIQPGRNYGWPVVNGTAGNPDFTDPVLSTGSDTWAPSGMTYYSGSQIPEWTGKFLVTTLRGQHLRVLDIDFSTGNPQVVSSTPYFSGTYGRLRDAVQGPDGLVYLATSNRDGRGAPNAGDDKILRISNITGVSSGTVEEVATGLEAPWSIAFSNNGTIYVTERLGRVRVVKQNVLQPSALATISVTTFPTGESGLLGLALDPDFDTNRRVYVYYTYTNSSGELLNRISRFTLTAKEDPGFPMYIVYVAIGGTAVGLSVFALYWLGKQRRKTADQEGDRATSAGALAFRVLPLRSQVLVGLLS